MKKAGVGGAVMLLTVVLCGGCNVEKIAGVVDSADTKLAGSKHVGGAVNYQDPQTAKDGWDRQADACRVTGSNGVVFGGNGKDVLDVTTANTVVSRAVVHGPGGDVSFTQGECSTDKWKQGASAAGAARLDGKVTLDCEQAGRTLRASIDFAGCGR